MHRIRSLTGAFVLGVALFVAGCADSPTAPIDDPGYGLLGSGGLLSGLDDTEVRDVQVVERSSPLERDEVVTETIGYAGGTIRLPRAGLTVHVPWGALRQRTEITVTAPAGNLVGYHFEPHGLEFARPVTLTQDLDLTDVLSLDGLSVAYFQGELEPTVTALESLPLLLLRTLGIFHIDHFSGYVIATN